MSFLEIIKKFLYKNLNLKRPILFAYSGGVDSSCLLDLLLKCKNEIPFEMHVVHIDHGWRKESKKEASIIKEKMKKLNICFHLKKIEIKSSKNLENVCRNMRLDFFKYLFKKYNFQALILAHQKDDLAETVLKRVLEGANIFSLTSMQEVSTFEKMTIWRPLLAISRKDILSYLNENNIEFFQDATNENVKYLRVKIRKDILPYLQKNFNKKIIDNLVAMSSYSLEVNNYLQKKIEPYLSKMHSNSFGIYIDLNEINEFLEIKYIIKKIANLRNIDLSRDLLSKLAFWILEKRSNLRLKLKNADVFADRGYFFIIKKDFESFNEKLLLEIGVFYFGPWQIEVKKTDQSGLNSSWFDFFMNKLNIYIPEDKYFIYYPSQNKKLKKIWENNKVPSFLRRMIPVVCNENKVTYEFLSGRKLQLKGKKNLQISLKLK
jgi:tRNA(Ile)-lysidine synthase